MDLRKIKALIELLEKSSLSELEIKEGEETVRLARHTGMTAPAPVIHHVAAPATPAEAPTRAPAASSGPSAEAVGKSAKAVPDGHTVRSPMVGTFYATPSPDSPNFVAIGSTVKADTVVCIIEAMKVMNEIQSELAGTIVECLVASGTSVEFGQPLFRVKVG